MTLQRDAELTELVPLEALAFPDARVRRRAEFTKVLATAQQLRARVLIAAARLELRAPIVLGAAAT